MATKFEVLLTVGAEQDLEAIHDYICEFDCTANADHVLDQLTQVVQSLSRFPERGGYPKELVCLGIKECWRWCRSASIRWRGRGLAMTR
jgi:toxin ParE1/3/4